MPRPESSVTLFLVDRFSLEIKSKISASDRALISLTV